MSEERFTSSSPKAIEDLIEVWSYGRVDRARRRGARRVAAVRA